MTRSGILLTAALAAMAAGSGCLETAHFVSLDANGGVVGIPSPVDHWPTYNRKAAEEMMKEKCPQGYVIDHEQEVAIGQTTKENTSGNNASLSNQVIGIGMESKTIETHPINEWQITFHGQTAASQATTATTPAP